MSKWVFPEFVEALITLTEFFSKGVKNGDAFSSRSISRLITKRKIRV